MVGKFSKTHYKSIIEPAVFKFLASSEPEVRAGACKCIEGLGKNLTQEEIKGKLLPILKTLAQDESQFVKSTKYLILVALAENILKLCTVASKEIIKENIIPIAM